jgi:hypothetical protein
VTERGELGTVVAVEAVLGEFVVGGLLDVVNVREDAGDARLNILIKPGAGETDFDSDGARRGMEDEEGNAPWEVVVSDVGVAELSFFGLRGSEAATSLSFLRLLLRPPWSSTLNL